MQREREADIDSERQREGQSYTERQAVKQPIIHTERYRNRYSGEREVDR